MQKQLAISNEQLAMERIYPRISRISRKKRKRKKEEKESFTQSYTEGKRSSTEFLRGREITPLIKSGLNLLNPLGDK